MQDGRVTRPSSPTPTVTYLVPKTGMKLLECSEFGLASEFLSELSWAERERPLPHSDGCVRFQTRLGTALLRMGRRPKIPCQSGRRLVGATGLGIRRDYATLIRASALREPVADRERS